MRPLRLCFATTVTLWAFGASREAYACESALLGPTADALAPPWHEAAARLVQQASVEGRPWSCVSAVVDLTPDSEGATLQIAKRGVASISRHVSTPDDVVPLGLALLAEPMPAAQTPAVKAVSPVTSSSAAAPATQRPKSPPLELVHASAPAPMVTPIRSEPRGIAFLGFGGRYAAPSSVSGEVSGGYTVPFDRWGGGVWGRLGGREFTSASVFQHETCVGVAASHEWSLEPVALRASLKPSVAFRHDPPSNPDRDALHLDTRVAAEISASHALGGIFRGRIAADVEVTPEHFASQKYSADSSEIDLVAISFGLTLGVDLEVR